MPILACEPRVHPEGLLARDGLGIELQLRWWAMYTRSRREKDLMRKLRSMDVPFYCPLIPHRTRSPGGRMHTSYLPLFPNYVFVYGTDLARYQAVTTGCISRCLPVTNGAELTRELRLMDELISADVPLLFESRLEAGDRVRVTTGPLRGLEGVVTERVDGQRRLVVSINFLQQGASAVLEDAEVERVD